MSQFNSVPGHPPDAWYREGTTDEELVSRTSSARRSCEMGVMPMRCRHCKQEVISAPLCSAFTELRRDHWAMNMPGKAGDAATTCEPGYLTPGCPFYGA